MKPMSNSSYLTPNLKKLLAFRLTEIFAYQTIAVAVGWHIYQLTHDVLSLGLIGLAEVVPYFCCALFAGHAVDHYATRRYFAILSALILAVSAWVLSVASTLPHSGTTLPIIYSMIVLGGVVRSFIAPCYGSLFALIVPRADLVRASSLGMTTFQMGLVAGPALGGILLAVSNTTITYAVAGIFSLVAAVIISRLEVAEPPPQQHNPAIFSSIKQGLDFVWGHQIMLGALSLDMFAVLFGGVTALLPAFISDILHVGAEGLGVLRASVSLGGIVTGIVLVRHPIQQRAGACLLWAVAGFGIATIAFAFSTSFWLSVVFLLLAGVCDGVSMVMRASIVQISTPQAMRGRVSAINGIFIGSSNELGAFESGVAARLLGLVPSVVFGGVMTLLVVATTAIKAPQLRKLDLRQLQN